MRVEGSSGILSLEAADVACKVVNGKRHLERVQTFGIVSNKQYSYAPAFAPCATFY